MKKYYVYISTLIFILFSRMNPVNAQQGSIPEYAMGARAYAMGRIALLSFSDAIHISMNPSSICDAQKFTASIFYSKYNSNTTNSSYGIVYPTKNYGYFGLSYFHFAVNGIEKRDQHNVILGEFSFNQNHLLLMYGRNITNKLSFGFNAKFVSQSMAEYKSPVKNIGFDIGVKYIPKFTNSIFKNLSFGITVDNLVKPAIKLDKEREYLPLEFRLILEDKFIFSSSTITFVGNLAYFEKTFESKNYTLHLGSEYSYKNIFLRIGYHDNYYSYGFGLKLYMLKIDYFYGKSNYSQEYATSTNGISVSFEL